MDGSRGRKDFSFEIRHQREGAVKDRTPFLCISRTRNSHHPGRKNDPAPALETQGPDVQGETTGHQAIAAPAFLRRCANPTATSPRPISASDAGSGTVDASCMPTI